MLIEKLKLPNSHNSVENIVKSESPSLIGSEVFEAIIQNTRDAIIVIDENGLICLWNYSAEKIFGWSANEALGKDVHKLIAAPIYNNQHEKGLSVFREIGEGPAIGNIIELLALNKEGQSFPVELLLAPYKTTDKFGAVAVVRDISEQNKWKVKLRKWEEVFKNSEWGLIVSEGEDMNIELVNPVFSEMLGYSIEEIRASSWKSFFPKDALDFFTTQMLITSENGRNVFCSELLSKDGKKIPVQIDVVMVKNEADNNYYNIVNVTDISEKLHADLALKNAERLSNFGELAAGVAHDFNNALQGILGGISHAINSGEFSEDVIRSLAYAEQSAHDVAQRIKQLQKFSGTSKETLELTFVDIRKLIEDSIFQTKFIWENKYKTAGEHFEFHTNFENNFFVLANAGSLRTVFFNLIKNSIEAMPNGGTLNIDVHHIDTEIVIQISDTGIGMNDSTIKRIFQPFFTTKGFEQGRGMGLSGVLGIIREHKGFIEVKKSEKGKGTTFEIRLPYYESSSAQIFDTKVETIKTLNVLWVDDEEGILRIAKRLMKKLGHNIDVASSANEAIELLKLSNYDLLISDVGMPDVNGFQLLRTIQGVYPNLKIVILSGWGSNFSEIEKTEYGISSILVKPVSKDQISDLINTLFGNKR